MKYKCVYPGLPSKICFLENGKMEFPTCSNVFVALIVSVLSLHSMRDSPRSMSLIVISLPLGADPLLLFFTAG